MAKFKIIFISVFMITFSAEAGYVRKLKEPDFFIPSGEKMHLQEKLPPIIYPKSQKQKIVKKETIKREEFVEVPEYKKKYDNYLQDVKFFVENNKMPENTILEKDLKDMESGDVFEVTQNPSQASKTKEEKEFNKLVEEIMMEN